MVAPHGKRRLFVFLSIHTVFPSTDFSQFKPIHNMESDLPPSTIPSPDHRNSVPENADSLRQIGNPAPTASWAAVTAAPHGSTDDLTRLQHLQLNESAPNTSASCSALLNTSSQVRLNRQSSINQYFTPLSLSPEPPLLFADTPTAVNHSDNRPRPPHPSDRSRQSRSIPTGALTPPSSSNEPMSNHSRNYTSLDSQNIANLLALERQDYGTQADVIVDDVTRDSQQPRDFTHEFH